MALLRLGLPLKRQAFGDALANDGPSAGDSMGESSPQAAANVTAATSATTLQSGRAIECS
jgi:hypothetical protein